MVGCAKIDDPVGGGWQGANCAGEVVEEGSGIAGLCAGGAEVEVNISRYYESVAGCGCQQWQE